MRIVENSKMEFGEIDVLEQLFIFYRNTHHSRYQTNAVVTKKSFQYIHINVISANATLVKPDNKVAAFVPIRLQGVWCVAFLCQLLQK